MRKNLIKAACMLLISAAAANLYADRRIDQESWAYYQDSAELTRPDLTMIWHQLISPRDAAKTLIRGMNFTLIPGSFNRKLHHLHYQLGHLAHNQRARWTPELVQICCKLERYIALFSMLENLPINTSFPVTLLGMDAAGVMPQTDCIPEELTSASPQWQAQAGTRFEAAIFALNNRVMNEITITASPWQNQQGQPTGLRPALYAMEYELVNQNWESRETPAGTQSLEDGLQIYKLSLAVPENLLPGIYYGKVTVTAPRINFSGVLPYQVTVKP